MVFLIIGSIIFGIYYFAIAKPAADALGAAKASAISRINSNLATIGTNQASTAASNYAAQVQAAGSTTEVDSIMVSVNTTIQTEQKREELLDKATTAATGSYYSATGTGTTKQEPTLSTILLNLQTEINAKTTLKDLQNYEALGTIDSQAATTWQDFFENLISGIEKENLVMKSNSPTTWYFKTKTDALAYVEESTWQTLRQLDFEGTSYVIVPISDTVNRTPTITAGSQVNVYVYTIPTEDMRLIVQDATVSEVLYSTADLATISWALSYDTTSQTYSTNIWETLKAVAAGSSSAAAVGWQNYGSEVMSNALSADVLNFTVNAIYAVRVPTGAAENIIQCEFHQTGTKDVILVARTT